MSEKTNLPKAILDHVAWDESSNPIWPASSFYIHRNIENYPFPCKMDQPHTLQTIELLKKALLSLSKLKKPTYLPAESLSPHEKEFLCEHFLSPESWQNASTGQAFIVDESAQLLGALHFQNHLLLEWIDCKGTWEQAWKTLSQIEVAIGETLDYAFSPKFGYLTSNPKLAGTGLQVHCYLHLPALIFSKKIAEELLSSKTKNIESSGLFGDKKSFLGDFLVLRNSVTLGISEETILKDLHKAATKLSLSEKAARILLKDNPPLEVKDLISRAYGLLMHSYQLDTKEALNALSCIKLGTDLGWIQGISDHEINELFFRCRRAHLLQSQEKISLERKELAQTRAKYLHDKLQKTTCSF